MRKQPGDTRHGRSYAEKISGSDASGDTRNHYILGIASIALGIIAFAKKIRHPHPANITLLLLNGLLGITLYMRLLNWGSRTIRAGTGSFIISAAPVFTALASIPMLGERINACGWIGFFIIFIGIGFINWAVLNSKQFDCRMARCSRRDCADELL